MKKSFQVGTYDFSTPARSSRLPMVSSLYYFGKSYIGEY